jgi:hypothetical protein
MGKLYPPTNARPATVTRSTVSTRTNSVVRPNTTTRSNIVVRTNLTARPTLIAGNTIPKGGAIRPPGGREWMLEWAGEGPWLPLRLGRTYQARVSSSFEGFTNVPPGKMILSLSSNALRTLAPLTNGMPVTIAAATEPDLTGLQHALGTGPMLVRDGMIHDVTARMSDQQHPRAAVGWNDDFLYFAVSDGRRKGISEGIRLVEMAEFMVALGCRESINMDGGQSTTLMLNGEVINVQTPGGKHEVANGIVVLRASPGSENDLDP